ncbi:ABC1 kinase family protein [Flagellimonas sp.]|uniref:ABC1 kinase family protein n=1 Tax=Flagellimonas sp. TaxID=2058762 RepID=UPI003F4A7B4B
MKRLLQKTNPIPFAQIENTIKELLKERYSLFDIEKQPLASASIAQVHRATFNGEKVVLKIVKPGIPELFEKDLRVLRAFMKMGTFFPFLANLPIMELYKELEEIILPQTDLLNEKKNLMKIKGNLLDFKDIAIPEIYKEGNSSKLLIMEFMNFPNEVDFDDWEMDKRIRTSNQILEMLFQMMFVDGLTHCDMHQGNLFIDYSGKLILLDFGMVTSMTKEETADFVRFFYHMSMNNGYQCAEILEKKAIFLSKKYSREKFFHEIEMFINKHWSLNVIDFETSLFTLEMIRIQNQNGIKGSTAFIHNILSIVFLEGILKNINPQLDFQLAAKKFIIRNKLKIK